MPEFHYDSFCGLYCGACDILQGYKKGLETGKGPQWSDLPAELGRLPFQAQKAEIKCYGCKTDSVFAGCSKCVIRKCAMAKTGLATCLDCQSYPCWRIKVTGLVRKVFRLETKLPHLKTIPDNIEAIRSHGLQLWLEEQDKQWQCPHCGKRLSWYRASCTECNVKG